MYFLYRILIHCFYSVNYKIKPETWKFLKFIFKLNCFHGEVPTLNLHILISSISFLAGVPQREIFRAVCVKAKIGSVVLFDENTMRRLKNINWAHSKRLVFGSLVLFTKDNCKSFLIGTILERDEKYLSKRQVSGLQSGFETLLMRKAKIPIMSVNMLENSWRILLSDYT